MRGNWKSERGGKKMMGIRGYGRGVIKVIWFKWWWVWN